MAITTKARTTYTVFYRMGGTARCWWNVVDKRFSTEEAAQAKCAEIQRGGYKALYEETERLMRIGLPEGWEPGSINYLEEVG